MLLNTQFALAKARGSEARRLELLRAKQSSLLRAAFHQFLREAKSPAARQAISAALASGDLNALDAAITQHLTVLGRALAQSFVNTAIAEAKALDVKRVNKAKAITSQVAVGFDPSNEEAARLIRMSQLQFIQQLTNGQRDAIRYALANAYRDGADPARALRAVMSSIGLTRYQVEIVENYRALLESGSAEALARELRDRRYDRTVERAISEGEPLDADQIDRMVARYQESLLRMRADTIAQTEGKSVVSLARQEAARQVAAQAGFAVDEIRRTWRSTKDKRTRDSHWDMDGQTVGLDEPFVTPDGDELMYPGDPSAPAKERINCRCEVTYEFGG